ncbi:DUF3592 domain-containing protein [Denitrobaculum tricleocarpae]|uniref:DUF3592 domain-containing protein n=1 Tax=Denitrobaculum tricleocarpae TaxID=2591009 RepID=A0A545TUB9_9PROT|nr:DUF3592 domain-containing protein [Denitrobaculum tricleocarpae]TQV80815.1 hypothetical protein FKG95_11745 [Denitrobaculum tricleocarpae]
MDDDWAYDGKPLFYLDRKVVAVIAFLFTCLSGYWYLHFTGLSEAFAQEAVSTRGKVLSVDKRACAFTDYCIENQAIIYTATLVFKDRFGRQWQSEAEFRSLAYEAGQKLDVHYLASDPSTVIAGDLEFETGIWTIFRIKLAIVTLICAFLTIGYCLPKGTLIKD